ncbi:MAG: alpha/beta hydrolase [Desulfamplus sp.]|nr:alpha/beta hydrolase [Desulfamplus sp.]
MELIPWIIAAFGVIVSIWNVLTARERLKIEQQKLKEAKKEAETQRLINTYPKVIAQQLVIGQNFLKRLTSIPTRLENQSIDYMLEIRNSKECFVFVSGLGLDHRDFESHARYFDKYDCLILTIYGFQPSGSGYVSLNIDDHVRILVHAINELLHEKKYEKITFVGFSIGADIGIRILLNDNLKYRFHRLLAFDPNINKNTCFISSKLASLFQNETPRNVAIQILSESDDNEWLDILQYLDGIFQKFGTNRLPFLKDFASQIVEAYNYEDYQNFASLISNVSSKIERCEIVLSDGKSNQKLIADMMKLLVPSNIRFTVLEGMSHFDLLKNVNITRRFVELA